ELDSSIDAGAVAIHGVFGIGTGGHAVRVVAGPEEIVGAVDRCGQYACAVVLIREENIIFEVFTGRQLVDVSVGVERALAAKPIIDLLDQVGDPTDVELCEDNFEFLMPVENTG